MSNSDDDLGGILRRVRERPQPQLFDCERHGSQPEADSRLRLMSRLTTMCSACLREEAEQREAAERLSRRQQRAEQRQEALALDARFAGATLAGLECRTPKQRAAVASCQAFVESLPNEGAGLLLLGPPGTGKSTLAAAVCRAAIDQRDIGARITTQRDLIRRLRATWRRDAEETEDQVIDELGGVGLLVLDDAGVGYGSDAEVTQLLDVIDLRYRRRLPTVVCTNLSVPQLRDALGDRTYDRLREGASFVACDWPSFRGAR